MDAYLLVHHTQDRLGRPNTDMEQIYFSVSLDGLKWKALNQGKPILESTLGEKGLRDPDIIRSPEGNKFYMVATDLNTKTPGGWRRHSTGSSQSIMVWESDDLVNWSDQRMAKVARDDAGCSWAPESVYDKATGEYMVHWASLAGFDDFGKHRLYCARTKDFVNFTPPEIYIERDYSVIDLTFLEFGGQYYRFLKGKTIIMEVGDSVFGEFKPVPTYNLLDKEGYEGPTVFKFNGENKFCLFLDFFGPGMGYHAFVTDDISRGIFTDVTEQLEWDHVLRHGSVIPITMDEYNRLCEKYGMGYARPAE